MTTDEPTGPGRDDHDEALARWFGALDAVPVPEVWDRVLPGAPVEIELVEVSRRPGMRRVLAVAAAFAALGGSGWFLSSPTAPLAGGDDPAGVISTDLVDGACEPDSLAAALGGDPRVGTTLPATPTELARGTVLVSGVLDSVRPGATGALVRVEVARAIGLLEGPVPDTVDLEVPGAGGVGSETAVVGSFVAYVDPVTTASGTWRVVPGGLWVACGAEAPAVPVVGVADTVEWEHFTGLALGWMVNATLFPDQALDGASTRVRHRSLEPAVLAGDGTAVFDVELLTSDRIRVAVPDTLADGFDRFVEPAVEPGVVTLTGPAGTLTMDIVGECGPDGVSTGNERGAVVGPGDDGIEVCDQASGLTATIDTDTDLGDRLDDIDIHPVRIGARLLRSPAYQDDIRYTSGPLYLGDGHVVGCGDCLPSGPLEYDDAGVVVSLVGGHHLVAAATDDLAPVWALDTGDVSHLHTGPDALHVEVLDGDLLRIDPATGAVLWRLDRPASERDAGVTTVSDDLILVRSSPAPGTGWSRPTLRAVDPDSGAVLWTADGRDGTAWQAGDPVIIDDLAVLLDVDGSGTLSGALSAYDLGTGRLVWSSDLGSRSPDRVRGMVQTLDLGGAAGTALLVRTVDREIIRIDQADGSELWRTFVGNSQIDGAGTNRRGEPVIVLHSGPRIALDPATGEPVDHTIDQPTSTSTSAVSGG